MAGVAEAVEAGDLRLDIQACSPGDQMGVFQDGDFAIPADIEDLTSGALVFQHQQISPGDVMHRNVIPNLAAILITYRGFAVERALGEDSQDSRLGVAEGLAGTSVVFSE